MPDAKLASARPWKIIDGNVSSFINRFRTVCTPNYEFNKLVILVVLIAGSVVRPLEIQWPRGWRPCGVTIACAVVPVVAVCGACPVEVLLHIVLCRVELVSVGGLGLKTKAEARRGETQSHPLFRGSQSGLRRQQEPSLENETSFPGQNGSKAVIGWGAMTGRVLQP